MLNSFTNFVQKPQIKRVLMDSITMIGFILFLVGQFVGLVNFVHYVDVNNLPSWCEIIVFAQMVVFGISCSIFGVALFSSIFGW